MSALSTLKSLFTFGPGPYAVKGFTTSSYTGLSGGGEAFGPFGQQAANWSMVADMPRIHDAYRKCSVAYACVTLLADAVAESPLRVYQTVDGELEERPDHRLRTLLANPNPLMSEAEFMSLLVMAAGMWGYTFVEKVRSNAGLPVELWPLRPDWVVRERTGQDTTRIVYRVPGQDPRPIDEEDLILVPYRHDERFSRPGISPLQIVAREIGIDVSLTDLLKVFIDSGGIPPWAVEIPETNPDQTKLDTFRLMWQQKYGGSRAYGNIGILYGGMKLVKVGDSIGDMAWPDLRGLTEAKIAQAFRVPLDLVQGRETLSSGSLTTTEMTGAMAFLQNHGAQPLRMRIDGAFSRSLLADYGLDATYSLEFDTSGILALQEDRDATVNRIRGLHNDRLITLNEARVALGYSDLGADGEVVPVLFNVTYLRFDELAGTNATGPLFAPVARAGETQPEAEAAAATNASADDLATRIALNRSSQGTTVRSEGIPAITAGAKSEHRTYRDIKALSPVELEKRASVLTTTRRERDKLAEMGTRFLRKFFKAQGERIVGAMPKSYYPEHMADHKNRMEHQEGYHGRKHPEPARKWAAHCDAVAMVKAAAINWDEEDDLLREVLDRFYNAVGERAFGTASDTLGVELAWDLANPNIGRVMDQLGTRIVDISETTRQDVIGRIAAGQQEGLSLSEISDSIRDLFEQTYKGRAETIARTETMVSYSKASTLAYEESGVVDSVELSDNPDHTESYDASDGLTCAERDGLVVNLGDVDKHIEAEHPNGSLAVIPILSTPLGESA
jgi:HK97 family phage portal protein